MSDRQARLARRMAARDAALREQAGIAPTEWAQLTPAQRKAAAAKAKKAAGARS